MSASRRLLASSTLALPCTAQNLTDLCRAGAPEVTKNHKPHTTKVCSRFPDRYTQIFAPQPSGMMKATCGHELPANLDL